MAGARYAGPILVHCRKVDVLDGTTCKAPSPRPGPATSDGVTGLYSDARDVRGRFVFREWRTDRYSYKEASGVLGVPGQVETHRNVNDQRAVSKGTGEHAGHLIGIQFGAPGDLRNLGMQNPNINTRAPKNLQEAFTGPGGSYYELESRWKELLLEGWRVHVTVTDKYRLNEDRPFTRHVVWTETSPAGKTETNALDYGNFSSPQKRAADKLRDATR
jgi:hypothetical protein